MQQKQHKLRCYKISYDCNPLVKISPICKLRHTNASSLTISNFPTSWMLPSIHQCTALNYLLKVPSCKQKMPMILQSLVMVFLQCKQKKAFFTLVAAICVLMNGGNYAWQQALCF